MLAVAEQELHAADYLTETDEQILSIEGLSKSFTGRGRVLNNVSLQLNAGSSVALIGPNGCGKSTLLRCCISLLNHDSGAISLFGKTLTEVPNRQLRSLRGRVGFIWQQHNLLPGLSVLTNVVHGSMAWSNDPRLWRQWMSPDSIREESMVCLEQVGLSHLAGKRVRTLSGGESQRVAIARALMQRPQLLLADEPAASLDPYIGEEVMAVLKQVCESRSAGLLFVSHDIDQAKRYADRLVGLNNGCLIFDKSTNDVSSQELTKLYA